ncbi:hypothetical protein TNCT_354191 [Trichonephila clavata]|uniref:Uncharacterized protein n=1 Tax=Trichonephila clavata TaxID=2740835 RepID=A0A8X6G7N0_TRICU|nr:hypothetical protein TNCT_354191 [Trichonephila clavata]
MEEKRKGTVRRVERSETEGLRCSALPHHAHVTTWIPGGRPKRAESAPGWNRVRPFRISGPFPDAAATFPSGALRSVGFFDFSLKRGPLLLAQLFCYWSH